MIVDVIEVTDDRCDACGARSFLYAQLTTGGTLSYCCHHGAAFLPRLEQIGATVIDLRHMVHA